MEAKVNKYSLTSINCNRLLKTNEPFVLAYQVFQVFYAIDNINKRWQVVLKTQRDSYGLPLQMDINKRNYLVIKRQLPCQLQYTYLCIYLLMIIYAYIF